MAFSNHLRDDDAYYRASLRQSVGVSQYVFDSPRSDDTRANETVDPRVALQGVQVNTCRNMPLVEVDTQLMGIRRKAGLASQYQGPDCTIEPRSGNAVSAKDKNEDIVRQSILDSEDCRMSNPPRTLRGTGINRFEWLCRDPQEHAIGPLPFSPTNYRLVAKDNYRPLVEDPVRESVLPAPIDQKPSHATSYGKVDVGKDIRAALESYPDLIPMQHWRELGEVQRIVGRSPAGPAPTASEEDHARMAISPF